MPLLYDQRYLEMSYLMHAMSQVSFAKCVNLSTLMAEVDILDPHEAPIEMSGVSSVIASARDAFAAFFLNDPATTEIYTLSLHDALPIFEAASVEAAFLCPGFLASPFIFE